MKNLLKAFLLMGGVARKGYIGFFVAVGYVKRHSRDPQGRGTPIAHRKFLKYGNGMGGLWEGGPTIIGSWRNP